MFHFFQEQNNKFEMLLKKLFIFDLFPNMLKLLTKLIETD